MDVGRSNQMGGYLLISNVRGSNLKVADIVSSDPYMILSLGSIKHKSKVKRKTLNPAWKSTFKFRVSDPITEVLRIQLYDHDYLSSHDSLGYVEIPVREVCDTKAQKVRKTYTLLGVDTGKLTAELVYRGIYNI